MNIGSTRHLVLASIASAFAGALGGTVATICLVPAGEERTPAIPASSETILATVEALPPVCRLVAHRSLKRALDQSRRAWISTEDVERLLGPLARGGSATCETINDQRFALGEI